MSSLEGQSPLYSKALLKYTEECIVKEEDPLDRFRTKSTTWLDSSTLRSLPGNPLNAAKLERVQSWLKTSVLDVVDEQGAWIGLPIVSVSCGTGEVKIQEGNHRIHVMLEERGAHMIPVQVEIIDEGVDCEEIYEFHNKLLDILFENGLNHSGFWSDKEVWRASIYFVIQDRVIGFEDRKRLKVSE